MSRGMAGWVGIRLHRSLVYWGLLKHPYGREYAKQHYTPTGKRVT
jgi:hypothetical protein